MRYLFTVIAILTFQTLLVELKAQGNLQFNQVVNQTLSLTASGSDYPKVSTTVTVPVGKVWKVESATIGELYNGSYSQYGYGGILLLDETVIAYHIDRLQNPFPIWLKEGQHTFKFQGDNYSPEYSWDVLISIIEFNVITN